MLWALCGMLDRQYTRGWLESVTRGVVEASSSVRFAGGWCCSLLLLIFLSIIVSFQASASEGRWYQDLLSVGGEGDFPARTITIVAPTNPGGGWDQLARQIQYCFQAGELVDVSLEVVNRGGAGGTIGLTEIVTQHRRDPYTLMVAGSTLVSAIAMHNSRFTVADGTPIARLASEYSVVAVPADSSFKNFDDLLRAFRGDPASIAWGGGSAGSTDHLLIGMIAQAAGLPPSRVNYVAYNGGGEAATAIMAGQLHAGVAGFAEWEGLMKAGKIRILAISSPERLPGVDIPTIGEFDLDVSMENWRFVMAPPGISRDEEERLVSIFQAMHESREWKNILERNKWEDRFLTGDALREFLILDSRKTAELVASLELNAGRSGRLTGPYLFPMIAIVLVLVSGAGLVVQAVRQCRQIDVVTPLADKDLAWSGAAKTGGIIFVYFVALYVVGFLIATPIYLVAQARFMGSSRPVRDIVIGVGLSVVILFLFESVLGIEIRITNRSLSNFSKARRFSNVLPPEPVAPSSRRAAAAIR